MQLLASYNQENLYKTSAYFCYAHSGTSTPSLCSLKLRARILSRFAPLGFVLHTRILGRFAPSGFMLCTRILSRFAPSGFALISSVTRMRFALTKIFEKNKCVSIDSNCSETHRNAKINFTPLTHYAQSPSGEAQLY